MAAMGVVFELPKAGHGYLGKATVLYKRDDTYGSIFAAPMMVDSKGNLIGAAVCGTNGRGAVFELVKTPTGYAAMPTVLVSFDGANGAAPYAGLMPDKSGNLYGSTTEGGEFGNGVVFEIAKTASGYANTPTILVNFNGANGATPEGQPAR
jgi:hypothetical protein